MIVAYGAVPLIISGIVGALILCGIIADILDHELLHHRDHRPRHKKVSRLDQEAEYTDGAFLTLEELIVLDQWLDDK